LPHFPPRLAVPRLELPRRHPPAASSAIRRGNAAAPGRLRAKRFRGAARLPLPAELRGFQAPSRARVFLLQASPGTSRVTLPEAGSAPRLFRKVLRVADNARLPACGSRNLFVRLDCRSRAIPARRFAETRISRKANSARRVRDDGRPCGAPSGLREVRRGHARRVRLAGRSSALGGTASGCSRVQNPAARIRWIRAAVLLPPRLLPRREGLPRSGLPQPVARGIPPRSPALRGPRRLERVPGFLRARLRWRANRWALRHCCAEPVHARGRARNPRGSRKRR